VSGHHTFQTIWSQRDVGPQLGRDRPLAAGNRLGFLQHLGGAVAGDEDDSGLVGHHHVAGGDLATGDLHRDARRALLQPAAGGDRNAAAGEDGEPQVAGLAAVRPRRAVDPLARKRPRTACRAVSALRPAALSDGW
jgi:hypothetical protein